MGEFSSGNRPPESRSRLTNHHVNVIKPTLCLAVRSTPSVLRNVLPGRSGRQRSGDTSQSCVSEVNFESFSIGRPFAQGSVPFRGHSKFAPIFVPITGGVSM